MVQGSPFPSGHRVKSVDTLDELVEVIRKILRPFVNRVIAQDLVVSFHVVNGDSRRYGHVVQPGTGA